MCLFTDASETHWAAVLTQVDTKHMRKPIDEQAHEPLSFLSGSFAGHSANWSIVEKEAYAVVEAMTRLDYLTATNEVSLFTDHANLTYIFDPFGQNPGISKTTANKLIRWALKLSGYRYVIEFLPGERNVWADLLTRWAAQPNKKARPAKLATVLYAPICPRASDKLEWPARCDIVRSQANSESPKPPGFRKKNGVLQNERGVFWIPSEDEDLELRFLIAAHTGLAGHRRKKTTKTILKAHFVWSNINAGVDYFCQSCIHCLATESGERIPRPLGYSIHASKPNEVLHFDFCYIGKGSGDLTYVLILKDDLSSYVRLYPMRRL